MSRPQALHRERQQTFAPVGPYVSYLVVRDGDLWCIEFNSEVFGPYRTEREALLFAIDAAYKLGRFGRDTQVLVEGDDGVTRPEWTYGFSIYPPLIRGADRTRRRS